MGAGHRADRRAGRSAGDAALSGRAGGRNRRDRRARLAVARACLLLLAAGAPLAGQQALVAACPAGGAASVFPLCLPLAQAAAILQPRLAVAAAGGSPLAGSASTLGMRLRSTPRVALELRGSGAYLTLPAVGGAGGSLLATAASLDAGVGLYGGLEPAPTLGGVGSLDLLGSVGVLPHGGRGLAGSPWTAGLGARLGILRESFTLPGISLSAVLRRTGAVHYGAPDGGTVALDHVDDLSLRAMIGKRLFAIGTALGVGLDHTSSEATLIASCQGICSLALPAPIQARLSQTRGSGFVDLTWTSLVLNLVAELGWQRGGTPASVEPPTGDEHLVRRGAPYGSLALRLTI